MRAGARPLPGYDGVSQATITRRDGQNGRVTLIRRIRNARQRGVQPRHSVVAAMVHKRSPSGVRLSQRACTYLVRAEICALCGRLLQRSHPGSVRRPTPTSWSMASSIAATTREKSGTQLVSGESGRSGRSVATHPPMKTSSRFASSKVSITESGAASLDLGRATPAGGVAVQAPACSVACIAELMTGCMAILQQPRCCSTRSRVGLKLGLESLASSRTERPWACVVQRCASGDSAPGLVGHEGAGDYGAVHLRHYLFWNG